MDSFKFILQSLGCSLNSKTKKTDCLEMKSNKMLIVDHRRNKKNGKIKTKKGQHIVNGNKYYRY